jgi:hypothetical protein
MLKKNLNSGRDELAAEETPRASFAPRPAVVAV